MKNKERKIKILLVEDDSLQSDDTAAHLRKVFGGPVDVLNTESELVNRLPRIAADPPDVFVIDINLRWTDPLPVMPKAPQRVLDEGKELAGFRCCDLLSECEETRHVPIVLYSIVDRSHYEHRLHNLPDWVVYIPKDNPHLLCDTIRRLIQGKPEP
jgi:CheY-like chemotaxis protein